MPPAMKELVGVVVNTINTVFKLYTEYLPEGCRHSHTLCDSSARARFGNMEEYVFGGGSSDVGYRAIMNTSKEGL